MKVFSLHKVRKFLFIIKKALVPWFNKNEVLTHDEQTELLRKCPHLKFNPKQFSQCGKLI